MFITCKGRHFNQALKVYHYLLKIVSRNFSFRVCFHEGQFRQLKSLRVIALRQIAIGALALKYAILYIQPPPS